MSSKSKSKRNSPKASGKTKGVVNEKKSDVKSERKSSNGLGVGATMQNAMKEEDIERIVSVQNRSLKNFVKTNELLGKFNDFSSSKYDVLQHMFVQHTRLLVELKKDLTNVFLRIRRLKGKLKKQHPEAFEATFNLRQDLEDRLEQETPEEPTYVVNSKEHNVDSKIKNEWRSKSERDQVEATNLNKNAQSEKGDTAEDTTAVRSDKRGTGGDEEHVRTIGTSGNEELVTESTERTETASNIEVVPQHQLSLEDVENEDAWLMVQKLDAGVALGKDGLKEVEVLNGAGQSLEGISGSLEDAEDSRKTMEKNMDSQERTGDDADEASRGLTDAEDRTMDNIKETDEDLKDTKDSQANAGDNVDEASWRLKDAEDRAMDILKKTDEYLKDTKDNLEWTGEDLEEDNLEKADFKDTKGNLEETRENLDGSEDNLKETDEDFEDTKDNLEGTGEDLEEDNLEKADFKDTKGNLEETRENLDGSEDNLKETDEDFEDTKDNLEGTREDLEEDNLEKADFKDTKGNLEETREGLQDNLKETDQDFENTKRII